MRMDDVDTRILQQVIARLGGQFDSFDVTQHPDTKAGHAAHTDDGNYNAMIAKVLRREAPILEIEYLGQRGSKGSALWRKTTTRAAGATAAQSTPPPSPMDRQGLGPQYAGDPPYQARMRRHQSWYRAEVLCVPYGTGPTSTSDASYGNMLAAEPAAEGRNFLTPQIHDVFQHRVGDRNIDRFRTAHNLLSSQAMCFNLFAPLTDDLDLATRCLQALLPGEVERVDRVEIEHTPSPKDEFLGDGTSFDALVVYEATVGDTAFLGIETKLHEGLTEKAHDKRRYRELTEKPDAPWADGAGGRLVEPPFNQLWRNHLLVEAVRRHPDAPCGRHGRFMLAWHPDDLDRTDVVDGYTTMLRDAAAFVAAPLNRVVGAWEQAVRTDEERDWAYHLRLRYLDLQASGHAS